MQLAWLEDLTKEGHVSEVERDQIYESCGSLMKLAVSGEKVMNTIERVVGPLAPFVIMPMIGTWFGRRAQNNAQKRELSEHEAALDKTRAALLSKPEWADHQDKVEARFLEVAKLAPTVARNENLMERILKEKLHSGLTHEDVTNLALIQATYTPNYAFQEKLEKKAALETAGAIAADVVIMCTEAGILKEGGAGFEAVKATLRHAATLAAVPVLLSAGAGVANAALDWRSAQNREKRLIQTYTHIMDPNHPDTELLRAEPERAREAFKTLVHFAPSVAQEPAAARSFMNKLVAYQSGSHRGGVQSTDLKELSEIEKNMRGAGGGSAFFKGFAGGLAATGFADTMKKSLSPLSDPLTHELSTSIAAGRGLESTKSPFQPLGSNFAREQAEESRREEQHQAKLKSMGSRS